MNSFFSSFISRKRYEGQQFRRIERLGHYAEWRSSQPEAATQWLNNLPADDPRRDPFFQSAIRQVVYNPQTPEQLAAMTPQEREVARTVIENMTSLPADRRARLLAGLTSP